ncbi:SLC13 family permease [Leekyejoonella antrihumi]|uniref:Arsenic transporter n=1 Tax=Leekyejoonella antrihumi TaxID=1660198 RepID=A0A563E1E2_9MICO|nr:SLC13 family permease [Leekyejoonella antrihumi]TWP36326.1 arsenic transporter [Leekyejoonella antrihumi]
MTNIGDLAARILPVMLFLASITVVAEISQVAGVFDIAGHWAARHAHHRTVLLWLLIVAISCLATIVLSLDTTAVLLTPVVLAIAQQIRVSPLPFALTTVWLANTASLLLPVSNLTNLLALHHFSQIGGYPTYLRVAWLPALVAIAVTIAVIAALHRRQLRGRFTIDSPDEPHDRVLLWVSGGVCLVIGPVFLTGVTPAIPATIAAAMLLVVLWVRQRDAVRGIQIPWRMIVAVCVVFVVIDVLGHHGLTHGLQDVAGTGGGSLDLLRLSATGAVGANLVNNLPAYLAIEPATGFGATRLMALLIGTNAGPLVTVWGSMATLLWRDRCRRAGVSVPLARFTAESALVAVCAVVAASLALAVA